jgi:hypothetical protein
VARLTSEDVERLASRVAMLASEDGEADNAGRAVGQMARRLGLSGGDLKAMFLDGARQEAQGGARGQEVERLERELEELRRNLRGMEAAARVIQWERDELLTEKGELTVRLYRGRARRRAQRIALAVGAVVLLLVGGVVAWIGPDLSRARVASVDRPTTGIAIVRSARARLLGAPKPDAHQLATMPPGTRLVVRRVLWNMMMQWAEVEMGGLSGYVPTTDLEMY